MASVSIIKGLVEQTTANLAARALSEVIDTGLEAGRRMLDTLEYSDGDFADSLKAQIQLEMDTVQQAGNLLITLANYINSAAAAFEATDVRHQKYRVN